MREKGEGQWGVLKAVALRVRLHLDRRKIVLSYGDRQVAQAVRLLSRRGFRQRQKTEQERERVERRRRLKQSQTIFRIRTPCLDGHRLKLKFSTQNNLGEKGNSRLRHLTQCDSQKGCSSGSSSLQPTGVLRWRRRLNLPFSCRSWTETCEIRERIQNRFFLLVVVVCVCESEHLTDFGQIAVYSM